MRKALVLGGVISESEGWREEIRQSDEKTENPLRHKHHTSWLRWLKPKCFSCSFCTPTEHMCRQWLLAHVFPRGENYTCGKRVSPPLCFPPCSAAPPSPPLPQFSAIFTLPSLCTKRKKKNHQTFLSYMMQCNFFFWTVKLQLFLSQLIFVPRPHKAWGE